ncbi:CDP-alcohol phosphatidyltransferase family protein [Mucilaginibacter sp. SP1R1]|uniref:CDP-alcohol phosphatidyltransferase family protein n=1 Tax=Mucilaginibacter sp. SP1R1 TaxID=2723091 RepID=UPI001609D8E7|nr:CDP-alcohol phosphatidyltransferase family protein [Mucilaginibacter sp. SP1R1]MBB6149791.1 CDP-diacylglycerol--glycerol-3-phosphate 3-phosphatidyltransferase [Mucilaginibacter sp. SP1R1]
MNKIPILLIFSRVVFGLVITALSIYQPPYFSTINISLIFLGLLFDIFDGIIARRLNISTPTLRRLDSGVDQFFWLTIIASCYLIYPEFFKNNIAKISILLSIEACCYLLSYLKFKKEVATHAIASKFWTLTLFGTLIQIMATGNSIILFNICFFMGIATRLEIMGMLLIIKQWTNDIPTIYHAILIRKGRNIKRNKLFNG